MSMTNLLRDIKNAGGTVYLVGGALRDYVLGILNKDEDYEVHGLDMSTLHGILSKHGRVDAVGKSFGVLKFHIDGEIHDFSLPRKETKVGRGHRDFDVQVDPNLTLREAAGRRDFTMNTLMQNVFNGDIIDPFNGLYDLHNKVLRAATEHFVEDPLRPLRAMQFCGRFDLTLDPDTAKLCDSLRNEYKNLSSERVWAEWEKLALKSIKPSSGIQAIFDMNWQMLYPEIGNMRGCLQNPRWHPEGFLRPIDTITLESNFTSSAQSSGADFMFRNLVSGALTSHTKIPPFGGATQTEGIYRTFLSRLFTTDYTGVFSFRPSSLFRPAIFTKSKSLMVFCGLTSTTDKIVRIMLKVPLSCMHTIMRTGWHDFEILDSIISWVSILMMDVFVPTQFSSQMQGHNNTMNSDSTTFTRPTGIKIPSGVYVDSARASIDGDIKLVFDFCINNVHEDSPNKNLKIYNPCDYTPNLQNYEIYPGDVLIHTMHVCDEAVNIAIRENLKDEERLTLFFAALTHDFGKVTHSQNAYPNITSHGHAEAGVPLAESFLYRINAPSWLIQKVKPLVHEHMAYLNCSTTKGVRNLSVRLGTATIQELLWLIEADHSGRPPLPKGLPAKAQKMLELSKQERVHAQKPKKLIEGRHLQKLGIVPGPIYGDIIQAAYQAQLNGDFHNEEEASLWVLHHFLNKGQKD